MINQQLIEVIQKEENFKRIPGKKFGTVIIPEPLKMILFWGMNSISFVKNPPK